MSEELAGVPLSELERRLTIAETGIKFLEKQINENPSTAVRNAYEEQLRRKVDDRLCLTLTMESRRQASAVSTQEVAQTVVERTEEPSVKKQKVNSRATAMLGMARTLTSFGFVRVKDNQVLVPFPETVPIVHMDASCTCPFCERVFGNPGGLAQHAKTCMQRPDLKEIAEREKNRRRFRRSGSG
jgi:hypothetical protein